jgi:2-phospho-L-lactate guanylyltransferase
MKDCIIIPLKRIDSAKSRLSNYLNPIQRKEFSLSMLSDVLEACISSSFYKIFLVTQEKIDLIHEEKIEQIIDNSELNLALKNAIDKVKNLGYECYLIIPSDIPLIEKEDLDTLKKLINEYDLIISPSFDSGTNALFMKKDKEIELEYGEGRNSFLRHLEHAQRRNLNVYIYSNERISLDIDDYARMKYLAKLDINKKSVLYIKKIYEENRNIRN